MNLLIAIFQTVGRTTLVFSAIVCAKYPIFQVSRGSFSSCLHRINASALLLYSCPVLPHSLRNPNSAIVHRGYNYLRYKLYHLPLLSLYDGNHLDKCKHLHLVSSSSVGDRTNSRATLVYHSSRLSSRPSSHLVLKLFL